MFSAEKGSNAKKGPAVTYKIDCSIPAADSIFDADLLKGFVCFAFILLPPVIVV